VSGVAAEMETVWGMSIARASRSAIRRQSVYGGWVSFGDLRGAKILVTSGNILGFVSGEL
jgi:hypothetical protein